MSGYVGDLSSQQESALEQFKVIVEEIPNKPDDTDHYYLRWLRARKFDVRKTEHMFREHLEFRKKYGADTILQDYTPPEMFKECIAGGFFGEDLDGHPIWYDNLGNSDPRGMYRSVVSVEEVIKLKCLHAEQLSVLCKELSEKTGKHIESVTVVMDFKNLTFQKHYYWPAIDMFKAILRAEEDNYPERTKTILLINTPRIFPFCYNIVKHALDERTRKKIVVLGINCNLKEELGKYISLDELPAMYGGNKLAPDEECSDFIHPGCDVPPKYYLTNKTETCKDDMDRVVVGRGSVQKARFVVDEVGSTLQWEFFSTEYDISFGVYMKKNVADKKEKKVVTPSSRVKSHLFPQTGQHTCDASGEYVFKFDNSYSWTRSKEIFYSIKILSPDVQPEQPFAAGISHDPSFTSNSNFSPADEDEDEFFECPEQGANAQEVAS